jgi:hypothetical protein
MRRIAITAERMYNIVYLFSKIEIGCSETSNFRPLTNYIFLLMIDASLSGS